MQRMYTLNNFFGNEWVTNRLIFAMIRHNSYLSSYRTTPLDLHYLNLEEIRLITDGGTIPHRLNVTNQTCIELYSVPGYQWETTTMPFRQELRTTHFTRVSYLHKILQPNVWLLVNEDTFIPSMGMVIFGLKVIIFVLKMVMFNTAKDNFWA